MIIHHTPRLTLRELTLDDGPFIVRLLNDPGWLRFIGDRGVHTIDEAHEYIRSGPARSYAEHGFGLYLVASKATREAIGICGLLKRPSLPEPDLGFAFTQDASGHGYATESGRAIMDDAEARHRLTRVLAVVSADHAASIHVLEKLGFRFDRMTTLASDGKSVRLFVWTASTLVDA